MRPTQRLLFVVGLWLAGAVLLVILRAFSVNSFSPVIDIFMPCWWLAGIGLACCAIIDALRPGPLKSIIIERRIPTSLALGVTTPATLSITNTLNRHLTLILGEAPSPALQLQGLPVQLRLAPDSRGDVSYQVTATARGNTELQPTVLRIDSPWHLWQHRIRLGTSTPLKIYPNFAPIAYLADVGMEQRLRQLGIHDVQARGEGLEFKQLREFVEGDSLRQVDWKATARQRKPISREYQDERDQDIFFLLDCGRRLRHLDDGLSHFDHALNAVLLTAYIALRQGDAVGLLSFAGTQRWLQPVKGNAAINVLLNKVYDLQSTAMNSDFLQVAEDFSRRHRKRSLVIIISNIHEEDNQDLSMATQLLSERHTVVVASLKEMFLDQELQKPVTTFTEALNYSATHSYATERSHVLKQLATTGINIVDALPAQLHIKLANEYLRLKKSHSL